jgi:outer membrane receptor for ferric coprogen and ferric-rhodotorulic acid
VGRALIAHAPNCVREITTAVVACGRSSTPTDAASRVRNAHGSRSAAGRVLAAERVRALGCTDHLQIKLNVNNSSDEKYITSLYQVGFYGAPRNAQASFRYTF